MMLGLDESAYQHPGGARIDWHAVRAAGFAVAIIKATEGTGYVNPYFAGDVADARAAGLRATAYHFYRPSYSAADQAHFFLSVIDRVQLDEAPFVDLEASDGLDWLRVANGAHVFVQIVADAKGECGLYYNRSWREGLAPYGAPWDQPEWVAAPGNQAPGTPGWQYGIGRVPGFVGDVDLDQFSGAVFGVGEGAGAAPGTSQRGNATMLDKADPKLAIAVVPRSPEHGGGEWVVFQDGGVHSTGGAPYYGSYPGLCAAWPQQGVGVFVDAKARTDVDGLTLLRQDGALYRFGADTIAAYEAGGGK